MSGATLIISKLVDMSMEGAVALVCRQRHLSATCRSNPMPTMQKRYKPTSKHAASRDVSRL
jgi:hypothetical protein